MPNIEVVEAKTVFQGFLSVQEAVVEVDGKRKRRLSVERGDSVGVLLHDVVADEAIFVRQFRYPCLRHGEPFLLELVAGAIDPGEMPQGAACREVLEEVGYDVAPFVPIQTYFGSPGTLSELLHLFYAEVSEADRVNQGNLVEGEDIEIVRIPLEEAWMLLDAGEIRDAKAAIALMWLRRRLGR